MRPLILAVLMFVFTLASHAEALPLPGSCLPLPLPSTPQPPTYSLDIFFVGDHALGTIWRQPCQDGSGQVAVLIRLTAVTASPFVCAINFVIVQNGFQRDGSISTSTSGVPGFCDDLFVPTTVVLLSTPDYDETAAFTLIYDGYPETSVEIPGAAVLSVTVIATGCTTCHPGNVLGYEAHVTNPGTPLHVEFKAGVRLPDGTPFNLLGLFLEQTFATGTTVVPILAGTMPSGVPPGAYTIEAALIEPHLGVTISRASAPLQVTP